MNGWNVDFCKFVDVLHSQCIDVSTFELFVGFLDYFSTYFQYKRHIIQINVPWQVRRNRKWRRCPMVISDPFELDHNLAQSVNEDMFQYICLCMEHCHSVFMDQNLRTEFLVSKGCLRGTTDKVHMNDDLLREYGAYLLHVCVPVQQPPIRQFPNRDRTRSCSTNTSSS